jgi:hypothetical protein
MAVCESEPNCVIKGILAAGIGSLVSCAMLVYKGFLSDYFAVRPTPIIGCRWLPTG